MTQTIGQQIKWDFETNGELMISDKNGNQLYIEFPTAYWVRREFDSQNNEIYYEDSKGEIIDNRPKPCENKEIVIEGEKFKLVKV
jgi:hypothetical protein